MQMLSLFVSLVWTPIAQGFDILPHELICCNTFDYLSCVLNNGECSWKSTESQCVYQTEPSIDEMHLCINQTNNDSCSFELNEELTEIPQFEVRPELLDHSLNDLLPRSVIEVTDGVYVATGYDLANTIIIETATGMVIIDTLSEKTVAGNVFNDYKSLRSKKRRDEQMKIEAIILTHYHTDHSMGVGFWLTINAANGIDEIPKVYAHEKLVDGFKKFFLYSLMPIAKRAQRQFGSLMHLHMNDMYDDIVDDKNLFINSGIGPHLNHEENATFVDPTNIKNYVLFSEHEYELEISDISLLLIHAPGETADQIGIWYNDKSVLFVGDNFYYAFPNLYSIRGTTPRDPKQWINSLDKFLSYNSEYLVGSHTLPLSGWSNIQNELLLYRDLIAFVHDQTIRYMAKQWTVNDIVDVIEQTLPDILKTGRKQQFYGTVEWSVRSIYDMYLGWFNGESSHLYPSNNYDRGEGLYQIIKAFNHKNDDNDDNMISYLVTTLTEILEAALEEEQDRNNENGYIQVALKEERWILEVITSLSQFYNDYKQCDEWKLLKNLRWRIIKNMAERSVSANGRNYLVSMYLEERYNLAVSTDVNAMQNVYMNFPMEWILQTLKFRVMPERFVHDTDEWKTNEWKTNEWKTNEWKTNEWKTNVKLTDTLQMFQLTLRNGGILDVEEYTKYDQVIRDEYDDEAQLIYEMTDAQFKNPQNVKSTTYLTKGGMLELAGFWIKFEIQTALSTQGGETRGEMLWRQGGEIMEW